MITYLEKYNNLPQDVKDGVSAPEVVSAIEELEKEYEVTLATVVMRVLVKDIALLDLPKFFTFEYDMELRKAEKLTEAMQERIFKNVGAYLGISIDPVIKEEEEKKEVKDKNNEKKIKIETNEASDNVPIRSSNFFFSPEDEEEVKTLAKKLKIEEVETEAVKQEGVEQLNLKVDKIVDQASLNFSSEELHQRFRKIVLTYVKGVRNKIDTKQTMLKEVKSGGLGLNDMLANKTLKIADKIKDQEAESIELTDSNEAKELVKKTLEAIGDFSEKGKLGKPKKEEVKLGDAPYNFKALENSAPIASLIPKDEKENSNRIENKLPEKEEIKKVGWQDINKRSKKAENQEDAPILAPDKIKVSKLGPSIEEKEEMKIDLAVKKEIDNKLPPNNPILVNRSQTSTRTQVMDVKKVPKLSGPVDELKDLDLLNFRRLSTDPAKAAAKIKEKLKFLEEDSYEKRLEGIKAWRASAVNKEYLKIGQMSIMENKGVQDIIEEKRKNDQNILSYGEFLAIMDLNRSIRF